MPIFEYKCNKCGKVTEALVRKPADELRKCPECGADKPEKIISASAISVKGGGASSRATSCGLGSPCCGASEPCSIPPCED